MTTGAAYLHGTSPAEQGRLSLLNRLMNDAALRELSLKGGEKIVDFGCGLGQLSLEMARAAGTRLVGIEQSEEQLARAERHPLLDLRQGDAQQPPLRDGEWGSFDVAHARFVLEHVRDPLSVVRHMVRAVRPGGRIVLQDDDHDVFRAWPEPPGFAALCAPSSAATIGWAAIRSSAAASSPCCTRPARRRCAPPGSSLAPAPESRAGRASWKTSTASSPARAVR